MNKQLYRVNTVNNSKCLQRLVGWPGVFLVYGVLWTGNNLLWPYESVSCLVMSDSLQPHGLQPVRLLCPWDSPGKNTEVFFVFLLQGMFLTYTLNLYAFIIRNKNYNTILRQRPLHTQKINHRKEMCLIVLKNASNVALVGNSN